MMSEYLEAFVNLNFMASSVWVMMFEYLQTFVIGPDNIDEYSSNFPIPNHLLCRHVISTHSINNAP